VGQLDGIVFGQGPGSFTGLRVACSVAKGLAYPYDLPLFPVSGLAAIAQSVFSFEPEIQVLAVLDARMRQVYWGCFSEAGSLLHEQVSAPEEVVLPVETKTFLAGVGFEAHVAAMPAATQAHVTQSRVLFPQAAAMIQLVERGGILPVSVDQALPVYVRHHVTQAGGVNG
jgi:tRNA threonylcarbamoyladenosine biosynthesis protein TsaB